MKKKKNPGGWRSLFRRMHEWEAEARARLASRVRRVTPTRRALEAEKRFRAAAKASGKRVRWDEAVAELRRTDPAAASVLAKRVAAMREWHRRKEAERYAQLSEEERRERNAAVYARRKERLREEVRKLPPVSCECGCGVSWCALVGKPVRYASHACKLRAYRRRRKRAAK